MSQESVSMCDYNTLFNISPYYISLNRLQFQNKVTKLHIALIRNPHKKSPTGYKYTVMIMFKKETEAFKTFYNVEEAAKLINLYAKHNPNEY